MRSAIWGSVVISWIVVVVIAVAHWNMVHAEGSGSDLRGENERDLIALSSDGPGGWQQVTIINARTHVMSVYHIERSNGAITLKSVRNIEADLMMDEFNTGNPLPREIRAMLSK